MMRGKLPSWPRYALERAMINELTPSRVAGVRCLNLGSGTRGRYASLLADADVDAVDVEEPNRPQPWRYSRADAADLPFGDRTFDLVVAVECFEHIEENRGAMREVARVMKPGALLVATTPTIWTWPFQFGRHGPHYYSRSSLRDLVHQAGLDVLRFDDLGGAGSYSANLLKSWLSMAGYRALGDAWWELIDGALTPFYWAASRIDGALRWPPSNYIVVARKAVES